MGVVNNLGLKYIRRRNIADYYNRLRKDSN